MFYIEIPWLKYKRFCQDFIKSGNRSYREYYGNYTEYTTKTVDLYQIYKFLCDNKPDWWQV